DVRRDEAQAHLTRCQVLQAVFAGKPPDAASLQTAATHKTEALSSFTPGFSLPLLDKPGLFALADVPARSVLVVQIGDVGTAGEKLFVELMRGLKRRHGERLHTLTYLVRPEPDRKKQVVFLKLYAGVSPV